MAATKWWICEACGYRNKPHLIRVNQLEKGEVWDGKSCEQCGAAAADGEDYQP